MIEIKINNNHFQELLKKGYSLDMIYLLKLIKETDIAYPNIPKVDSLIKTLIRKNLLTESEELTEEGASLLEFINSDSEAPKIPRKKIKIEDSDFIKWWKEYPATDSFEYRGKTFKGSRALKTKKEDCKKKIENILKEDEFTLEELIMALKIEKEQKAEQSYKTGTNKMSYFQNSLTYLNARTFEAYVELFKSGYKLKEENKKEHYDGFDL